MPSSLLALRTTAERQVIVAAGYTDNARFYLFVYW